VDIFTFFSTRFDDFILIFARTTAILAVAPIFGSNFIHMLTKAFLGFTLAVLFTGTLSPIAGRELLAETSLFLLILNEVAVGAAIGIIAHIMFEIVVFAGYITDYQIGFGFINIVDPMSGQSISIIAFFSNLLAMTLFLILDFHHFLLAALVESYDFLPVYSATVSDSTLTFLTNAFGSIFYVGFKVAAPMIAVMFIVDFSLGVLGKTVPQLQILVVGFPVKISIGLTAFGLALHAWADHIIQILNGFRDHLFYFIQSMEVLP